mgnify:CR=1 FL=1
MAKKKLADMNADELRAELKAEQDKSDALQKDKERLDTEAKEAREKAEADDRRARADAEASRNEAPSEAQWVKLEEEYGMERTEIQKQWRFLQRAQAPLVAELNSYKARDAANDAVSQAKKHLLADDAQFPKYERFVDEYLGDIPMADKADPEKLKRHMDRAVHFARGKARSTDKNFREDVDSTRDSGSTQEEKDDAAAHFGEFQIAGMPLTITNNKLVPDDFRKRHQHPEQREGVRMNEKARWKDQIPVKPR